MKRKISLLVNMYIIPTSNVSLPQIHVNISGTKLNRGSTAYRMTLDHRHHPLVVTLTFHETLL